MLHYSRVKYTEITITFQVVAFLTRFVYHCGDNIKLLITHSLHIMYLTGFADEAAADINGQIKATKILGWRNIESRNINGANIHNISDEDFDSVVRTLEENDIQINCFGSEIANWSCSVNDPLENAIEQVKRAIPRMKRLGTSLIRIMSYKIEDPNDLQEEERFRRVGIITKMFTDEGLVPVHENCMNYGGLSAKHTLKLVENVPGLKLVFDTCNPIFTKDHSKQEPYPYQSSWDFYSTVKEHIAYIHIKDGYVNEEGKTIFTFPGEGSGDVPEILADLVASGYDGGISIEPHLKLVVHAEAEGKTVTEDEKMNAYVEYGRRVMKMLDDLGAQYE